MKVLREGRKKRTEQMECRACHSLLEVDADDVQPGSGQGVIVCPICNMPHPVDVQMAERLGGVQSAERIKRGGLAGFGY